MKNIIRFALLVTACALYLQSGWVSYSQEQHCPEVPALPADADMKVKENFLAAHGISHEQFSIWLKEHSVWRKKNAEELKQYSFIPQDYDTERK